MKFDVHIFFTFLSVSDELRLNVDRIEAVVDRHWDDAIVPFSLFIVAVVFTVIFTYIYIKANGI